MINFNVMSEKEINCKFIYKDKILYVCVSAEHIVNRCHENVTFLSLFFVKTSLLYLLKTIFVLKTILRGALSLRDDNYYLFEKKNKLFTPEFEIYGGAG